MVHLGDIKKISGRDAPPVDCIIGGSPCQDLSIAGKREGLAGARSGLFMEQIRIVKELRDADRLRGRTNELIRPRYMVWENVPGAFSSNGGEDFRAVLEETARIAEPGAAIPRPEGGRWKTSGCIVADGWSIAWRVLDAQFWGVPQRRRRIALVADFGGRSAPEILFIRKSVCGNPAPVSPAGQASAAGTAGGAGGAITIRIREGCAGGGKGALIQTEKSGTLGCHNDQTLFTYPETARSITARYGGSPCIDRGPNIVCAGFKWHATPTARGIGFQEECAPSMTTDKAPGILVQNAEKMQSEQEKENNCQNPWDVQSRRIYTDDGKWPALYGGAGGGRGYVQQRTDRPTIAMATAQAKAEVLTEKAPTIMAGHERPIIAGVQVRRLTPLECERLQGFPDGWTDIGDWTDGKGKLRQTTDAARYKALGNSIALPPWAWVLKRLCACFERPATMASLFDGIGGFPLLWERLNGKGTCLWASEIEDFPIAVTRARFAESEAECGADTEIPGRKVAAGEVDH